MEVNGHIALLLEGREMGRPILSACFVQGQNDMFNTGEIRLSVLLLTHILQQKTSCVCVYVSPNFSFLLKKVS